jgi:endonuclease/exonuclease/phosphatase family metal-dependent hydrolase
MQTIKIPKAIFVEPELNYDIQPFYKKIPEFKEVFEKLKIKKCITNTVPYTITNTSPIHMKLPKNSSLFKGMSVWVTDDIETTFLNANPYRGNWFALDDTYATFYALAYSTGTINVYKTKREIKLLVLNNENIKMIYNMFYEKYIKYKEKTKNKVQQLIKIGAYSITLLEWYEILIRIFMMTYNVNITPEELPVLRFINKREVSYYITPDINKHNLWVCDNKKFMKHSGTGIQHRESLTTYVPMPIIKELNMDGIFVPQALTPHGNRGAMIREIILPGNYFDFLQTDLDHKLHWKNWTLPPHIKKIVSNGFLMPNDIIKKNTNNVILSWYANSLNNYSLDKIPVLREHGKIVIVSFNCHSWDSIDATRERIENAKDFAMLIHKLGTDIVLLQENYTGGYIKLNNLMRNEGYYNFYHGPHRSGLSIYSKYPLTNKTNTTLLENEPGSHRKVELSMVTIQHNNETLTIGNTHFNVGGYTFNVKDPKELKKINDANKKLKITEVKSVLSHDWDILAGDFNYSDFKNINKKFNQMKVKHKWIDPNKNDPVSTTPFGSIVDHFFTNKTGELNVVNFPFSDHNLLAYVYNEEF